MNAYQKMTNDGFTYHFYPAASGNTRALVVVLHGHASSPERWVKRCEEVRQHIPDAAVIAVQGPVRAIDMETLKQPVFGWLDFSTIPRQAKSWLSHAFNKLSVVAQLNRFIGKRLDELNLNSDRLAIVGSSMGGIIALQAAFNSENPYGAVVGYSTSVLPLTRFRNKQEVYLAIGANDAVFNKPVKSTKGKLSKAFASAGMRMQDTVSRQRLEKAGVPSVHNVYQNVGHEITDKMWEDGNAYIARRLGL